MEIDDRITLLCQQFQLVSQCTSLYKGGKGGRGVCSSTKLCCSSSLWIYDLAAITVTAILNVALCCTTQKMPILLPKHYELNASIQLPTNSMNKYEFLLKILAEFY